MSFLEGLTGTVASQHLPLSPQLCPAPLDKFPVNKKLKARLLWVDPSVKKAGLTLQSQLVEGRAYEFEGLEIGDVYEGRTTTLDYVGARLGARARAYAG